MEVVILNLKNNYSYGNIYKKECVGTNKWIYDYFGMIDPIWSIAVAQIPTITGSVI